MSKFNPARLVGAGIEYARKIYLSPDESGKIYYSKEELELAIAYEKKHENRSSMIRLLESTIRRIKKEMQS